MALTRGIDVSFAQGEIDWAAVRLQSVHPVGFAFARATEGLSIVDTQYSRNSSVLRERGIPHGAYHLFRFPDDPAAQAAQFMRTAVLDLEPGCLLPFVDLEDESAPFSEVAANIAQLAAFTARVEARIGQRMLIYCSPAWWNEAMGGSDAFSGHPLFVANYGVESPEMPYGWQRAALWQFTSGGLIDGIDGYVDRDALLAPTTLADLTIRER